MESVLLSRLLLIGLLLALAAFFAAAEAALLSLNPARMERLKDKGRMAVRLLTEVIRRPANLILSLLIAHELVQIALSVAATSLALRSFGEGGVYLAIGGTVIALWLFGELTPRHLAVRYPEPISQVVVWPLQLMTHTIAPLRWGLRKLLAGILGMHAQRPLALMTDAELETLIELGQGESLIDQDERLLIQRVFEFGAQRVSQIMTPRTDIFALEVSEPLSIALAKIKEARFSRVPVYEESIDRIVGILYAKDLLTYGRHPERETPLRELLHPAFFVPESKRIDELLREFQRNKVHLAMVVDEYGGVSGLVTMEDALEELVGEIVDEFDTEEILFRQVDEGSWLVSARLPLHEFNAKLGVALPEGEFETVGGYVLHLFGKLPKRGESVSDHGLTFTVELTRGTRIFELRVARGGV